MTMELKTSLQIDFIFYARMNVPKYFSAICPLLDITTQLLLSKLCSFDSLLCYKVFDYVI